MLLDTSGLLCLHHRDEPRHADAAVYYAAAPVRLIHSYVLAELVPLAETRGLPREPVLAFLGALAKSRKMNVVWVSEPIHYAALDLLQARLDKTYSLCDAVSFVLLREHGITEALTTDHHFEQEGFTALLRR